MKHVTPLALLLLLASATFAQLPAGPNDFPQWRGPNRNGISNDKGLLKEWPKDGPEVAWKTDGVGVAYSSIAIKDGILVTMGDLDGVEHTIALRVEDGSRIWAVQPELVAKALAAKVEQEFVNFDRNNDGVVDEVEALSRLGWDFYRNDRDGTGNDVATRAKKIFADLDADSDGVLSHKEAGNSFRDRFQRMDSSDEAKVADLASSRTTTLFKASDADNDGKVTRKEARGSYLDRIFGRADQRDKQTNESDQVLTREEVIAYFTKHEAGKDGTLAIDEVTGYYKQHVKEGNGTLSRAEIKQIYGGYRNGMGDGPRGTPTIDGNRVYAEGGNGDLSCLDLQTGKTHWYVSLTKDFGGGRPGWGYSESPLVVDGMVIVTPGGKGGAIVALNKMNGEVIWRSESLKDNAHYSSAAIATIGGVRQVVQFTRENVCGVSLDKGELLWTYTGACNGTANCCTPIASGNHVFAASAYGTGGGLVKITNDGQSQRATEVYFEKKMGIHHGGIVKIGDYMYTNGGGKLMCVNFLTGKIEWQNRSVGKGSLVAADGMLYVLSEGQQVALVEANPKSYREHGKFRFEGHGRPSWAHPVVAGGKLYIRDQHTLTAYNVR